MTVGGMFIEKNCNNDNLRFLSFFREQKFKFVIKILGGMCLWDVAMIYDMLLG